jgi:hypothetical protein
MISARGKIKEYTEVGDRQVVFSLLLDKSHVETDLLSVYDTFVEDIDQFELEVSKRLNDMISSIDLKKNENIIKDFIESVKLVYNISDSLNPEEKRTVKKGKEDNLLVVDESLLDKEVPEYLQSPENSTNRSKKGDSTKREFKQAKSMYGAALEDPNSLKINLKQINSIQASSNNGAQAGYFSNYQAQTTGRALGPNYMMGADKMDMMQSGLMLGSQRNVQFTQGIPGQAQGLFPMQNQQMGFPQAPMDYMGQPAMQNPMSSVHLRSDELNGWTTNGNATKSACSEPQPSIRN